MKRFATIVLAGLGVFIGQVLAVVPLQKETREFFPLARDGTITLEHSDGSIHIYGWPESRVRVAALRKAYSDARLNQIQCIASSQPNALTLRTAIPKVSGLFADRSGIIDYTLTVPETARLNLRLTNGEITLQGLRGGSASIELVNGRVLALNCFATVRARSTNGVMEAFFEWWENLPASFDYALPHGRIGARLPAIAKFRVDAETASGGIGNDFGFKDSPFPDPGEKLKAKNAQAPPVSFLFRTGGGNISIDRTP